MKAKLRHKLEAFAAMMLLCCSTLIPSTSAQAQTWSHRPMFPSSGDLKAIISFPWGLAFCVGDNGVIERSSDSGKTWLVQSEGQFEIRSVASSDGEHVVAVAADGTALYSNDSGFTWSISSSGMFSCYGVASTGPYTFVVAGGGGEIARTTDGGIHWLSVKSGVSSSLNSIAALDVNILISGGDSGLMLRSSDGGVSWYQISSGTIATLRRLTVVPSIHSTFVYGDRWTLLKSSDSGKSWNAVILDRDTSKGPNASVRTIIFYDSMNGVASVTDLSAALYLSYYQTSDGGNTWIWHYLSTYDFVDASTAFDTSKALLAGQGGKIVLVRNHGNLWSTVNDTVPYNYMGLNFVSNSNGFAITRVRNYDIYRSTNAGHDWIKVLSTPSKISSIRFPSPQIGYAFGPQFLARSDDSGASWIVLGSVNDFSILSISFSNPARAVLISGVLMFVTNDSGKTWSSVPSPKTSFLGSLSVLGNDTLIVLAESRVFRSTDFGNHWDSLSLEYTGSVVRFDRGSRGWIVGSQSRGSQRFGSVIYSSTDAGATWTLQLYDTLLYNGLSDIGVSDSSHAIAVGSPINSGPTILETSDAGLHWSDESIASEFAASNLAGVSYPHRDVAYLLSSSGILYTGIFSVSSVNKSSISRIEGLAVIPNPVVGADFTIVTSLRSSVVDVLISDAIGRIRSQLLSTTDGDGLLTVHLQDICTGSYYIQVQREGFLGYCAFTKISQR